MSLVTCPFPSVTSAGVPMTCSASCLLPPTPRKEWFRMLTHVTQFWGSAIQRILSSLPPNERLYLMLHDFVKPLTCPVVAVHPWCASPWVRGWAGRWTGGQELDPDCWTSHGGIDSQIHREDLGQSHRLNSWAVPSRPCPQRVESLRKICSKAVDMSDSWCRKVFLAGVRTRAYGLELKPGESKGRNPV